MKKVLLFTAVLGWVACGEPEPVIDYKAIADSMERRADSLLNNFELILADTPDVRLDSALPEGGAVTLNPKSCQLEYSEKAQSALLAAQPEFETWDLSEFSRYCGGPNSMFECSYHQLPYAVVGDFNGDDILDAVLFGHTYTSDMLLGIVSDGDEFYVHIIEEGGVLTDPTQPSWKGQPEDEIGLYLHLMYEKPQELHSPYEDEPLALKNDGFTMIYCEKAAVLYYFKDGQFVTYTTGD